jgi:hypothetical protein
MPDADMEGHTDTNPFPYGSKQAWRPLETLAFEAVPTDRVSVWGRVMLNRLPAHQCSRRSTSPGFAMTP